MKSAPIVNLLLTGQIRDVQAFKMLTTHLIKHRSVFLKFAFVTWTQEIVYNTDTIEDIRKEFEIVDAGNLIPVSPTLNRDIISLFAQLRQVSCGADFFSDDAPILRIRADDQNICKLDLTHIMDIIHDHWNLNGNIKTIVKAAAPQVPGFLDDRLYILSQFHISQIKKYPLWKFLATHQRNIFPEFILYYPILTEFSSNLDKLLLTDVRSLRNQGPELQDIGRWLSKEEVIDALNSYSEVLKDRVDFFSDVIPHQLHDITGLSDYIFNLNSEFGPINIASTHEAIKNLIDRLLENKNENNKIENREIRSRRIYESVENKKMYIEIQFANKNYKEVIKFYKLFYNYIESDLNIKKIIGISYFYTGDKKQSILFLKDIFEKGVKDFISLFYLSAAAVDLKEETLLMNTLREISRLYIDQYQAADHVINCLNNISNTSDIKSLINVVLVAWSEDKSICNKIDQLTAKIS